MAVHPLFIVLGLSTGVLAWGAWGLPALLSATYQVADFCQSLFVRCLGYAEISKFLFIWSGAGIVMIGLAYGAFRNLTRLSRANKAVKGLPLGKRAGDILLIDDPSKAAFTHGLFRPRIYVSKGLLNGLEREELKAVFLHELHHKRRFDPLRFFLLSVLKDSFFYLPVIKHWVGNIRAKKEHEADDAASSSNTGRLNLAGALVKVASHNRFAFVPASITGGSPVAARIRRLVEGKEANLPHPGLKAIALSVAVAVFLTFSLTMPLSAANSPAKKECTTNHCSTHIDRLGKTCKTHCDLKQGYSHHGHH